MKTIIWSHLSIIHLTVLLTTFSFVVLVCFAIIPLVTHKTLSQVAFLIPSNNELLFIYRLKSKKPLK